MDLIFFTFVFKEFRLLITRLKFLILNRVLFQRARLLKPVIYKAWDALVRRLFARRNLWFEFGWKLNDLYAKYERLKTVPKESNTTAIENTIYTIYIYTLFLPGRVSGVCSENLTRDRGEWRGRTGGTRIDWIQSRPCFSVWCKPRARTDKR